jgi:hypothetical protein
MHYSTAILPCLLWRAVHQSLPRQTQNMLHSKTEQTSGFLLNNSSQFPSVEEDPEVEEDQFDILIILYPKWEQSSKYPE